MPTMTALIGMFCYIVADTAKFASYVDFYDPDHSLEEHRFILLGESAQGRLLFVSYMERNNGIRLISAREATLLERKAYEQE